jgi:hypothetical protein
MSKSNKYTAGLSKKGLVLILFAFFFSLVFALVVYIFLLQTPTLSRRELFYTFLLWLLFTPLVFLLLTRFLLPRLNTYTPRARSNWILLSVGTGLLFALVTRPPQAFFLLPAHTLRINLPAASADRSFTLEYATTSLRDISFDEFELAGEWQRTEAGISHSGGEPASLNWIGRTGDSATLVFTGSSSLDGVILGWNDDLNALDTARTSDGQVTFSSAFPAPWHSSLPTRFIIGFTFGFLFLILSLFLAGVELRPAQRVKQKKGAWLLYALPMVAVWGLFLLTFFPGMMSTDSVNQWNQMVTGVYNDAHPVFHTILIWLLTRIWFSPAIIAIFQILTLSLTVTWGISILDGQGIPRWAAWALAAFFALFPINGDMVIILWKDIPYATSLLLLSLMILKIVFSQGDWLSQKSTWIWLGLVSLCVAGFRHNGIPISLLTIPILVLVYKKWWKPLFCAFLLFLGLWFVFKGPVLNSLNVNQSVGSFEQILVHHIAAHIYNGKPLSSEQQTVADAIIPRGSWEYNCCTNVVTMGSPDYSDEKNASISSDIRRLFIELMIGEPEVELKHQVCVSSLVWETTIQCPIRGFLPYNTTLGKFSSYSSYDQNSQIGFFVKPLAKYLFLFRDLPFLKLAITPSIYLYLSLFCTFFFCFRKNSILPGLFWLPSGIQSIVLILVNISSAFRYQYGVMLVGMFSLGLLILALNTPNMQQAGLKHLKSLEK